MGLFKPKWIKNITDDSEALKIIESLSDEKDLAYIVKSRASEHIKIVAAKRISNQNLLNELCLYSVEPQWGAGPWLDLSIQIARKMDATNEETLKKLSEIPQRNFPDETEEEYKKRKILAYTAMEQLADKSTLSERLSLENIIYSQEHDSMFVAELYIATPDNESKEMYYKWLISEASSVAVYYLIRHDNSLANDKRLLAKWMEYGTEAESSYIINAIEDQTLLSFIALGASNPEVCIKATEKITDSSVRQTLLQDAERACAEGRHFWEQVSSDYRDNYATTDNYASVSETTLYKCKFCDEEKTVVKRWH